MDSGVRFGVVVMVPLTSTFIYVLAVFSHGLSGDLGGRPSLYPARLFTLPVTSARLAGWPMLYGGTAMAVLWLPCRGLILWAPGLADSTPWPAVMGASPLAWAQA